MDPKYGGLNFQWRVTSGTVFATELYKHGVKVAEKVLEE